MVKFMGMTEENNLQISNKEDDIWNKEINFI